MDPQRLARRAGSFTLLLLFVLSVSNSHASFSRGHPSKDVRIYSGPAETHPIAEQVSASPTDQLPPSAQEVRDEAVDVVAEPAPENSIDLVTEPVRVAFGGGPSFGPKALGKIQPVDSTPVPRRGASGYLPEAGFVSLRFASPRRWPDPLPPPVEEVAGPEVIFVLPPIAARKPVIIDNETVAETTGHEASQEATAEVPADTYSAIADLIAIEAKRSQSGLTADMVVSSLNVLLHRGGNMPARFEPAVIADPVAGVLTGSIQ